MNWHPPFLGGTAALADNKPFALISKNQNKRPHQGPRLAIYNGIFDTYRQPESGMLLEIPNRAALEEKA